MALQNSPPEISRLLGAWSEGDLAARDELIPLVFNDLRAIARRQYEMEPSGHTLQPTAVVNELYMRLAAQKHVRWQHRREFFAFSSKLIRRILVDHARRRQAIKRGQGEPKLSFDDKIEIPMMKDPMLLALDDALERLATVDERGSRVVELHVFGGLQFLEIAELLEISRATVMRDWKHARLWLRRQLGD